MFLAPLAGAMAAAPAVQAAGLFDFLFGSPEPPRYRGGDSESAPLKMRVNPKGHSRGVSTSSSTGAFERKAARQKSIDPVAHPNWYLDDPTLRRGDIVVLKGGRVLVFDGGRAPLADADFTSLRRSNLVSKAERERIEKMARRDPSDEAPAAAKPPTAQSTAIETPPREASLR